MDPVSLIMGLVTSSKKVMAVLDAASNNKDTCKILKKHIESIMSTAQKRLNVKGYQDKDLQTFVRDMNEILDDTLKVADEIKKMNKIFRAMKTKDHDEQLQKINLRLSLLADQATFLIMAKVYEDDHIKRAHHAGSWSVSYEEICLFCHVTTEGHILIAGERSEANIAWWELRKYDEKGNDMWHWQCSDDIAQPTDVAQIVHGGDEGLAILLEDQNRIVFMDEGTKSAKEVFKLTERDYKLRRMVAMGHRVMVTMDPTVAAKPDAMSQVLVLNSRRRPFTVIKRIPLKCLDTHSLADVGPGQIAVCCGRPEIVQAFDADEELFKWKLEPTQISGTEVTPEGICCVGGDICVSDSNGKRIVTASGGKRGNVILPDVGDFLYSIAFLPNSKKLVVLHEINGKTKITLFKLE